MKLLLITLSLISFNATANVPLELYDFIGARGNLPNGERCSVQVYDGHRLEIQKSYEHKFTPFASLLDAKRSYGNRGEIIFDVTKNDPFEVRENLCMNFWNYQKLVKIKGKSLSIGIYYRCSYGEPRQVVRTCNIK